MIIAGTIPAKRVKTIVDGGTPVTLADAVHRFTSEHPGARVESIDDTHVRGICACGEPVTETTTGYAYDWRTKGFICPACNAAPQPESDR